MTVLNVKGSVTFSAKLTPFCLNPNDSYEVSFVRCTINNM